MTVPTANTPDVTREGQGRRRPRPWRALALALTGGVLVVAALWARTNRRVSDENTLAAMPLPALLALARRHTDSEPLYHTLGLRLEDAGRPYEAVAALDQALTIDPRSARSLDAAGRILIQNGQPTDAAQYFAWALGVEPDRLPTRRALALLHQHRGEWEPAAQQYGAILKLDAGDAGTWGRLGECWARQGRLDSAMDAYRRAIARAPQSEEYRLALGRLLDRSRRRSRH